MTDSNGAYSREFRASWRSTLGSVTLLLFLIALVLAAFVVFASHQGVPWLLTASLAGTLALAWLTGRPLLGGQPVLRVGPEGLSFHGLKGAVLPWREVLDVRDESVQGHAQIVLSLLPAIAVPGQKAPGRRSARPEKRIALGAIKAKDHAAVLEAVLAGFAVYGGEAAARALEAREQAIRSAAAFEARLQAMTPVTWGLYLVVALNVGVWLANIASGMGVMTPLPADLLAWGANSAASVVEDRDYWRLLTATFLHGGLLHIALNMLGLWAAGKQLNRLHGNAQFLLIYFGSALAGSALSLHFSAQQSVSVGASGAVFGVLGALFVAMYRHRGQIPSLSSKNVMTSQGVFLAYALVQGFGKQGIDNAAHVGGLLAGCLLAWLLVEKINDTATPRRRQTAVVASVLVSFAAVSALVVTTPTPTVHHRQLFEFQAGLTRILPTLQAAEKAFQDDGQAFRAGTLSEAQFVQAIEARHLPAYRRVQAALAPLHLPANDRAGAGMLDIKRANSLLVEAMQLQVDGAQAAGADNPAAQARIGAIGQELTAINSRIAERADTGKSSAKSGKRPAP